MTEAHRPRPEIIQPNQIMAWLGPDGTFTKMAADQYLREREGIALSGEVSSIRKIFELVGNGSVDLGIVPTENSTAGPVKDTHQAFTEMDGLTIVGEVIIPIKHFLYMAPGVKDEDVKEVRSKREAILQCMDNIKKHFPIAKLVYTDSTTEAVKQASEDPRVAGIGSEIAASAQGLDRLVQISGFEDNPNNATTFVVIRKKGKEVTPITERDKTTFIADMKDQPGSLFSLLREFANQNINLTKIKSLISSDGNVSFLISVDGHENEERIHSTLSRIESTGTKIKRLGSYEKATYPPTQNGTKPDMEKAVKMIQEEIRNGRSRNNKKVAFTLPNQPRALLNALYPFARRGINLTEIDSLPSGNFEEYIFYLSFDAENKENEEAAIKEFTSRCTQLKTIN